MPCSCEGYPPSPCYGDLLGCAEAAMERIKELEDRLEKSNDENEVLKDELKAVKKAFSIMGNGA